MNPANAKNTKGVAKKAIAKAPVEAAAEAKLSVEDSASTGPLGSAFTAQVVADSDGGQSGGGMGSAALILGGLALAGGIAVAAAGGGKDTDTNTVPIPTPTPPQPLPSYTVAASATSVDEGKSITFTITDANKVAGQKVTWSVNSERAGDIEGPTSGEVTIDQTGKATVTIAVKEDATTETAAESLTFTVGSQSASATINDTSKTPPPAAKTFTLTTGVDAFVGGDADDAFTAYAVNAVTGVAATNLNSTDTLTGGAGKDTLTITVGTDGATTPTIYNGVQQGTITGIEVINVDNTAVLAADRFAIATGTNAGKVSAAYEGATEFWQVGGSVAVIGLAATTTAGFKAGNVSDVTAASTAATATVALSAATGANSTSGQFGSSTTADAFKVVSTTITGAALSGAVISGSVKTETSGTAGRTGAVNLTLKTGTTAAGVALDATLNTALLTKVTLGTSATAGNVAKFDASASTGGIEYGGNSTNSNTTPDTAAVASILTGSGADIVTIATATAVDVLDTAKDETVNASLSTGAGKDTITVNTSGGGKTTVDAGADADKITLTGLSTGGASINAGDGDDTVITSLARLVAGVSVTGGAGSDTLSLSENEFTTANYLSLEAYTSGFENVTLTGDDVTVAVNKLRTDVSKVTLSEASSIGNSGATVTGIDSQAIVLGAGSKFNLTSLGYDASGTTTVYGASINASTAVNSTAVTAKANAISLAITATAGTTAAADDVLVTLAGDVVTGTVSLTSTRDASSTGTALGTENIAKMAIDLDSDVLNDAMTLNAMTSFTVIGAGEVSIDASNGTTSTASPSGKLDLIDLSGMTAFVNLDAAGDQVTGTGYGYQNLSKATVALNDANAEVVKLGGGDDVVKTASTLAKMDTIEGYQLAALVSDATAVDASKSDSIDITDRNISLGGVKVITISSSATSLAQALLEAGNAVDGATALDNVVFRFQGNTYYYGDDNTAGYSDSDVVLKFTGELNLALLAQTIA